MIRVHPDVGGEILATPTPFCQASVGIVGVENTKDIIAGFGEAFTRRPFLDSAWCIKMYEDRTHVWKTPLG